MTEKLSDAQGYVVDLLRAAPSRQLTFEALRARDVHMNTLKSLARRGIARVWYIGVYAMGYELVEQL